MLAKVRRLRHLGITVQKSDKQPSAGHSQVVRPISTSNPLEVEVAAAGPVQTRFYSSPRVERQISQSARIDTSSKVVAQRQRIDAFSNSTRHAVAQRQLSAMRQSLRVAQMERLDAADPLAKEVSAVPAAAERESTPPSAATPPAAGGGVGLPGNLKAGIESLSGIAMDDVSVHYNSAAPSSLNAHAYAQGQDIHVAPGQEQHLPHEAWHVVQQAQGRVRQTTQMKTGTPINDDEGLEREADAMGERALQAPELTMGSPSHGAAPQGTLAQSSTIQRVQIGGDSLKSVHGFFARIFTNTSFGEIITLVEQFEKLPITETTWTSDSNFQSGLLISDQIEAKIRKWETQDSRKAPGANSKDAPKVAALASLREALSKFKGRVANESKENKARKEQYPVFSYDEPAPIAATPTVDAVSADSEAKPAPKYDAEKAKQKAAERANNRSVREAMGDELPTAAASMFAQEEDRYAESERKAAQGRTEAIAAAEQAAKAAKANQSAKAPNSRDFYEAMDKRVDDEDSARKARMDDGKANLRDKAEDRWRGDFQGGLTAGHVHGVREIKNSDGLTEDEWVNKKLAKDETLAKEQKAFADDLTAKKQSAADTKALREKYRAEWSAQTQLKQELAGVRKKYDERYTNDFKSGYTGGHKIKNKGNLSEQDWVAHKVEKDALYLAEVERVNAKTRTLKSIENEQKASGKTWSETELEEQRSFIKSKMAGDDSVSGYPDPSLTFAVETSSAFLASLNVKVAAINSHGFSPEEVRASFDVYYALIENGIVDEALSEHVGELTYFVQGRTQEEAKVEDKKKPATAEDFANVAILMEQSILIYDKLGTIKSEKIDNVTHQKGLTPEQLHKLSQQFLPKTYRRDVSKKVNRISFKTHAYMLKEKFFEQSSSAAHKFGMAMEYGGDMAVGGVADNLDRIGKLGGKDWSKSTSAMAGDQHNTSIGDLVSDKKFSAEDIGKKELVYTKSPKLFADDPKGGDILKGISGCASTLSGVVKLCESVSGAKEEAGIRKQHWTDTGQTATDSLKVVNGLFETINQFPPQALAVPLVGSILQIIGSLFSGTKFLLRFIKESELDLDESLKDEASQSGLAGATKRITSRSKTLTWYSAIDLISGTLRLFAEIFSAVPIANAVLGFAALIFTVGKTLYDLWESHGNATDQQAAKLALEENKEGAGEAIFEQSDDFAVNAIIIEAREALARDEKDHLAVQKLDAFGFESDAVKTTPIKTLRALMFKQIKRDEHAKTIWQTIKGVFGSETKSL